MIIKCYNEKHQYLLFVDLEFNNRDLVQFAGLLFKWIDNETYQLMRSCNVYISQKVCYPFAEYTAITNNFLEENGIPLADAKELIKEFLENINIDDMCIIGHGLKNDRLVLVENGIEFTHKTTGEPIDGYCTFNNAKRILGRVNHLTLADLAEECGYYLHAAHNAYNDVWAEVAIFTYLKKIEAQKGEN